jgi:hypothetical protein
MKGDRKESTADERIQVCRAVFADHPRAKLRAFLPSRAAQILVRCISNHPHYRIPSVALGKTAMPTEHDTDRSDRLLRTMQPVLSHDLPNQLVALESLVNMLEFDDTPVPAARLRETVHRLQRVVRKTVNMVRFLKELERLGSHQCRLEEIRLAGLIREVGIELRQQIPELSLECSLAGDCGTIVADRRLLTQAVVELLRCLLEARAGSNVRLQLAAQKIGKDTELRGTLPWPAVPPQSAEPLPPRLRLDKRPEIVLARQMLAVWGGGLAQVEENADCSTFALSLSPRSAHA